jgi:hypothetical protein
MLVNDSELDSARIFRQVALIRSEEKVKMYYEAGAGLTPGVLPSSGLP